MYTVSYSFNCCFFQSNKILHLFPKANPSIELDLTSRRVTDVDFCMIIIPYNRPWSLHRLLLSLNTMDYSYSRDMDGPI